jgi:hypothetical protein
MPRRRVYIAWVVFPLDQLTQTLLVAVAKHINPGQKWTAEDVGGFFNRKLLSWPTMHCCLLCDSLTAPEALPPAVVLVHAWRPDPSDAIPHALCDALRRTDTPGAAGSRDRSAAPQRDAGSQGAAAGQQRTGARLICISAASIPVSRTISTSSPDGPWIN